MLIMHVHTSLSDVFYSLHQYLHTIHSLGSFLHFVAFSSRGRIALLLPLFLFVCLPLLVALIFHPMSDPWSQVATRLAQRDHLEKHDSEFYSYFAQLARLRPSKSEPERLEKENRQLRDENDSLVLRLNKKTLQMELAEAHAREQAKAIETHKSRLARLQQKIDQLTLEIQEKNHSIQILTDENLVTQIQQNVMKGELDKLKAENDRLLHKVLEKKGAEAEAMNSELK